MFNWYYTFIIAAAIQGFMLALFLGKVKNNKQSLIFLSPLIVVISLTIIARIFYDPALFPGFAKMAVLSDVILFIYGPLLYFYIKTVYSSVRIKKQQLFIHFIPAIIHFAWLSQFLFVDNAEISGLLTLKIHQTGGLVTEVFGWLHISFYSVMAVRLFFKYPAKAKDLISNMPEKNFINYFFTFNFLLLLSWAFGFILLHFHGKTTSPVIAYNSIWLFLSFNIFLTGYNAIVFPQVFRVQIGEPKITVIDISSQITPIAVYHFDEEKEIETIRVSDVQLNETGSTQSLQKEIVLDIAEKEVVITKKQKSSFDEDSINILAQKLEQIMQTEKAFLDANLTLPILAVKLSASVHYLSKTINENFKENFFDYINKYRVYHFIGLIHQEQNGKYTILSLAFESGFNSKSAFNGAFKKVTGKTPTAFIKELQSSSKD